MMQFGRAFSSMVLRESTPLPEPTRIRLVSLVSFARGAASTIRFWERSREVRFVNFANGATSAIWLPERFKLVRFFNFASLETPLIRMEDRSRFV